MPPTTQCRWGGVLETSRLTRSGKGERKTVGKGESRGRGKITPCEFLGWGVVLIETGFSTAWARGWPKHISLVTLRLDVSLPVGQPPETT